MDGQMIVKAWESWRQSPEGRECANGTTLNLPLSHQRFLHNRLQRAFQAGIKAAENAEILQFNKRHADSVSALPQQE